MMPGNESCNFNRWSIIGSHRRTTPAHGKNPMPTACCRYKSTDRWCLLVNMQCDQSQTLPRANDRSTSQSASTELWSWVVLSISQAHPALVFIPGSIFATLTLLGMPSRGLLASHPTSGWMISREAVLRAGMHTKLHVLQEWLNKSKTQVQLQIFRNQTEWKRSTLRSWSN